MTTHLTLRSALTLVSLALLGACSSPPKLPNVDESQKRPANAQMAVDLQVCKNDLQNTRIQANESSRLAETTTATLARMKLATEANQPRRARYPTNSSGMYLNHAT